jgi:predicted nucleic acid-binding protein
MSSHTEQGASVAPLFFTDANVYLAAGESSSWMQRTSRDFLERYLQSLVVGVDVIREITRRLRIDPDKFPNGDDTEYYLAHSQARLPGEKASLIDQLQQEYGAHTWNATDNDLYDRTHIATASVYGITYFATWENQFWIVQPIFQAVNTRHTLHTPVLVKPSTALTW